MIRFFESKWSFILKLFCGFVKMVVHLLLSDPIGSPVSFLLYIGVAYDPWRCRVANRSYENRHTDRFRGFHLRQLKNYEVL